MLIFKSKLLSLCGLIAIGFLSLPTHARAEIENAQTMGTFGAGNTKVLNRTKFDNQERPDPAAYGNNHGVGNPGFRGQAERRNQVDGDPTGELPEGELKTIEFEDDTLDVEGGEAPVDSEVRF